MQDSKGDYLVTRLSPCIDCLRNAEKLIHRKIGDTTNYELIRQNLLDINSVETKLSVDLNCDNTNNAITNKLLETTDFIFCFILDDVCYSVLKNTTLSCPRHGVQTAGEIGPDLAFEDIQEQFLIANDKLKIENLLGRGSFGFVFSGFLNFNNHDTIRVAVKVLETLNSSQSESFCYEQNNHDQTAAVDLDDEDKKTQSNRLRLNENLSDYWNYRKSIRLAAKAYTVARQEISILSGLKHDHIVSMIGLTLKPLAIILELAPLGNLKEILEAYKKNVCKLSAFIIQQVAVQISSAFVYLHANRIIYRDLKSENVLVWKFPMPKEIPHQSVCIKLADYSISRSVLPTGTKGFAGTEGFMAPEIVRFNGEETYSDKVDCFSFGMLLYELISLRHPFEGQEQIKDIILNDVRPVIKSQETLYPVLMLDLMCLCWLDNPAERPTAKEINVYAQSYEFSHLLDVNVLDDYEEAPLVVSCLNKGKLKKRNSFELKNCSISSH